MLNRALIALTLFAALAAPMRAAAQPAVPAVPPARGAAPAATDLPPTTTGAATPTAPAPAAADLPPTTDAAGTAFAPAPAATAAAAPPTTDAPPTTSAAPPTTTAPAVAAVPEPQTLQTVTKNYPLTSEGNARFLATYAAMPGVVKLPSGVLYRPLVVGKGTVTPISRMDTVTVSYRGWLIDGTSFDNSPPGSPRSFQLSGLIEGWREALLKMKVGDLWEVAIPSALAYGEEGRPGRIPPNQTLVFVISLAKIEYAG